MNPSEANKTVVVKNPKGLHLRPAGVLAQLAAAYDSEITLTKDGLTVDARSILDLLTLVATQGSELTVAASGSDAQQAVEALSHFIANDESDEEE